MKWKFPKIGTTVAVETGPDSHEFQLAEVRGIDRELGDVEVTYPDGTSGSAVLECIRGSRVGSKTPKAAQTSWSDDIWEDER